MSPDIQQELEQERWGLLKELDAFLDKPMIVLSLVWAALIIIDITEGLIPPLQTLSYVLWGLFVVDFVLGFIIAPRKGTYLKEDWLTALSIILPAFRILRLFRILRFARVLRAAKVTRSLGLLRVLTSSRRAVRAIGETLGRRGFGYVMGVTVMLIFLGAAGLLQFESAEALRQSGYDDTKALAGYGDALWWTGMIMTTIGSEYWPRTPEGRILAWLLSAYAVTVVGYIAATFASHFVRMDKENPPHDAPETKAGSGASGSS